MAGSFGTISTALSALQYTRVALDAASGNVANVGTEGYARRRVEAQTIGAPNVPAMWSRYDTVGDGVRVGGLTRMVDPFLDARARQEHGAQSYLDVQGAALARVESGINEPGDNGLAAAISDFRSGWQDLANNPGSSAARAQVLARAGTLVQTVGAQNRNVQAEAESQRSNVLSMVAEANTVSSDLAATNRAISVAQLNGSDASTLLDKRDTLAMRLAELTGARAVQGSQGNLDVTLNGQPLVTGAVAGTLVVASGVAPDGSADGLPVTFAVTDSSGTTAVPGSISGELGASAQLLTTTLPDYLAGLDSVVVMLADEVNAQHAAGFDAAGGPGAALFSYSAADPSGSLAVALSDPADVAASGLPGGVLDGSNAVALGATYSAEDAYQRLVNGFGTQVASVQRLAANQQVLTEQVDGSREQLSGVNLDEEMVNMLAAQRAYEAAAKVLSTVDSMLDTLINRTGLLR